MFLPAFFGLGTQEILLLAILGGGLAVLVVVLRLARAGGPRSEALEEENRRLREENDRLRGDR